jgi:4-amino-4-deoxy-L-arabinose transferase-like glycosyltransferase
MTGWAPIDRTRYLRGAALALFALLLFRLALLWLSPLGLHGDEAQYWAWSQHPDFGYYSKPPLIAWIIWVTTSLFGDAEWAVRLASPFLHTGTALVLFAIGVRLYPGEAGLKAGLWAGALYSLSPGVALSATLISTDAALLFFIALFVLAWVRLREPDTAWHWAVLLGVAFGFGALAKYAMIYVLPAFAIAILFDKPTRQAVLSLKGALALAVGLVIIAPNLMWNANNSFATLVHTTDNANMQDGLSLKPNELFEFLFGQLGVFGPVTFPLLLIALWRSLKNRTLDGQPFNFWLALLVVTPLLFICVQALLSRANANWAAAAYASAPILLAGWAISSDTARRWMSLGLILNLVISIAPGFVMTSPTLTDQLGFANSVKRLRGWPETVTAIEQLYAQGQYDAIAVDNRLLFYDLTYYDMEATAPLFMWRYEPRLNNHAELTKALPEDNRSVLLISHFETYEPYFNRDFDRIERVGTIEIDLGGERTRRLRAYAASGYKGPAIRPE